MNFFTAFSVYALYPCSTFLKKRTLVCGTMLSPAQVTLNKYEARGWTPIFLMTAEQLLSREGSDFKTNTRRIGDAICWVHRRESDFFVPMVENVNWCLQYNIVNGPVGTEDAAVTIDSYYPFLQVVD